MTAHLAFTQQRRANAGHLRRCMTAHCLLDGLEVKTKDGSRRPLDRAASAPVVNETKLAIVAVMSEFDCPMTSNELYGIFDGERSLKTIEYHLPTLVKATVAEVVFGPELHFRLVRGTQGGEPSFRERYR
jgi:hypothetical protein